MTVKWSKLTRRLKMYLIVHFLVRQWFHICPVWNRFCNFLRDLTQKNNRGHSKTFRIQAFHTSYYVFHRFMALWCFKPIREGSFERIRIENENVPRHRRSHKDVQQWIRLAFVLHRMSLLLQLVCNDCHFLSPKQTASCYLDSLLGRLAKTDD